MLTDPWFLLGLGIGVVVLALTAIGCIYLHRLNDYLEQREPQSRRELESLYTQWRVFLLNVRIASYKAKEKGGTSLPRPHDHRCSVVAFPRLPSY